MKTNPLFPVLALIIMSGALLSACGVKSGPSTGELQEAQQPAESAYTDALASSQINFSQTYNQNQEFKFDFKTYDPDGQATGAAKVNSFKPIDKIDDIAADEGKSLFVLNLSIKGSKTNKGMPSTFNQIGDHPSPQFVIVDPTTNQSIVEETYFSDAYTQWKKLYSLSEITTDQEQWVTTAIVFQIDKGMEPHLAFRFTNLQGETEFYDIRQ